MSVERPPIDLARPRSVGEILRAALSAYARHPLMFATLAAGVIAPYELIRLAAIGVGPLGSASTSQTGMLLVFELAYYVLVGPLISALHVHAVVEMGRGSRPRLGPVALRGLQVLAVVVAAEVIAGILIALGFVALIVPGVILSLRWSVVAQAAAIEPEGWQQALRRSARLAAGHYWHIFGLLLASGLITGVVNYAAAASVSGRGTGAGAVAVGIVVYTIVASFTALTLAMLYFDLRARERGPTGEVAGTVGFTQDEPPDRL